MPTSSVHHGPPLCHKRGESNRSLARRDNRCGTHPTTAAAAELSHSIMCYYYFVYIYIYAILCKTRPRGRRPGRNVSSASDARGGPTRRQTYIIFCIHPTPLCTISVSHRQIMTCLNAYFGRNIFSIIADSS